MNCEDLKTVLSLLLLAWFCRGSSGGGRRVYQNERPTTKRPDK